MSSNDTPGICMKSKNDFGDGPEILYCGTSANGKKIHTIRNFRSENPLESGYFEVYFKQYAKPNRCDRPCGRSAERSAHRFAE